MDSQIFLLLNSFLFKSPNIFSPYTDNANIDVEKLFSSVSVSQNIFMYSHVDYSNLFSLKEIKRSQLSIIEGIEIFLGNKKIIIMSIAKTNKNFVEVMKLIGERKILIDKLKNSHELIATKGLSALDELDEKVRNLTKKINELKEEFLKSFDFEEYNLSKDEIENLLNA